jgi:uncharacterized protein YjbI with pentapeptide repeats
MEVGLLWTVVGSAVGICAVGIAAWQLRVQILDRRERRRRASLHDLERDAKELRAAIKQLGSGNASIRIAGLYGLERVAENHARDRQRVTEVICAYLRMPPPDPPPGAARGEGGAEGAARESPGNGERRAGCAQEADVRLVAQQVLARHLREPRASEHYTRWLGVQINLRGAKLTDLDLAACELSRVDFRDCQFLGDARFDGVCFIGEARFDGAQFRKVAGFDGARFTEDARFDGAHFDSDAAFIEADFGRLASFRNTEFRGFSLPLAGARFWGTRFSHAALFDGAWFEAVAGFANTGFCGNASFASVKFAGAANFSSARFDSQAWFAMTEFQGRAEFTRAIFNGKAQYHRAQFTMPVEFDEAEFHTEADYGETLFGGRTSFSDAKFCDSLWFGDAQFAGTAVFRAAKFIGIAKFGDSGHSPKFKYMPDFTGATATYDDRQLFPRPWTMERPPAGLTIARLVLL